MPKPIGITALFFGRCNFDFVGSHELRELVSSVQVIDIFFELSVALWVLTNNIYTDKIINTKRKEK